MIVYCNGDSFVAGVELADYMLPEYPGCVPFHHDQETSDRNLKWIRKTYDMSHEFGLIRKKKKYSLAIEEKNRAWPNKLKTLLGSDVINSAQAGSSMDRIARTTISDLISLKKNHDDIVAIIGTTGAARSEVPHEDQPWVDIIHNYKHQGNTDALIDYKINYEKDYHAFVNFYKNLIQIQDFCKVNNIRLLLLATVNGKTHENLVIEENYKNEIDLKNLVGYANLSFAIDMFDIAAKCDLPDVIAPSSHLSESVHSLVADKLYNILKE